ncbi:MAG TPA: hypothetical protein GX500_08545 [Firmicutes bacterium]|nr:hypothetical protein [Candidatus Fermentithermobacillaceae bacterium]
MPTVDKPKALQLPETLMARLSMSLGEPVTVYLMGVHAPPIVASGPCPPYEPMPEPTPPPMPGLPSPGTGTGPGFAGPPLTPGIPPGGGHVGPIPPLAWDCPPGKQPPLQHMATATVTGTLAFAGMDYLVIRIPVDHTCTDILIPYSAVGMIVFYPMG